VREDERVGRPVLSKSPSMAACRFKVPRHVLFLTGGELSTTPTGKVRNFELVRLAADRLRRDAPRASGEV
jgi:hypothetical protein